MLPFGERLEALLRIADRCAVSRGYPGEGRTLEVAAASVEEDAVHRVVVRGARVLDGTGRDPVGERDVIVEDGRLTAIQASGAPLRADIVVDAAGATLLPGLTDAHVHLGLVGAPPKPQGEGSLVDYALLVRALIERTLHEGFTTVRDAGGLDPAWARAVAAGRIRGPRILPSGSFLTQTGGHGDARAAHEAVHGLASIPGLVANPEVVDGADAVRRAAREQLRRGATQIKLFVSGGVMSPTDPLESIQFTVEEIAAAVEVARSWGTYVLVHAHTSPAMRNALAAGARSIEHASILDEETARQILAAGAFVVPTLLIVTRLPPLGPAETAKATLVAGASRASVGLAHAHGIPLGSGSDLVGVDQAGRAGEIVEKAREIGPMAAIVSATRVNAELFGRADRIGTVEPGKDADLILVRGDPLERIETIAEPDGVPFVLQRGEVVRNDEDRASAA